MDFVEEAETTTAALRAPVHLPGFVFTQKLNQLICGGISRKIQLTRAKKPSGESLTLVLYF